jgi:hypothetical protein
MSARKRYANYHCEGSIPQVAEHFATSYNEMPVISGSLPRDSELIDQTSIDLDWEKTINFNHEFVGKAALKAELEGLCTIEQDHAVEGKVNQF